MDVPAPLPPSYLSLSVPSFLLPAIPLPPWLLYDKIQVPFPFPGSHGICTAHSLCLQQPPQHNLALEKRGSDYAGQTQLQFCFERVVNFFFTGYTKTIPEFGPEKIEGCGFARHCQKKERISKMCIQKIIRTLFLMLLL